MPNVGPTLAALRTLAARARSRKPDLTPAIGVVNDVGRFLADGLTDASLLDLQAGVASVREQLEAYPTVDGNPADALQGADSHLFAAGALWACNEIVEAHASHAAVVGRQTWERSDRAALRMRLLEWLGGREVGTLADFVEHAAGHGIAVRRDQLSKALGDLLRDGHVTEVPRPAGADRRHRFLALRAAATPTPSSNPEIEGAVREIRAAAGSAAAARALFDAALRELEPEFVEA